MTDIKSMLLSELQEDFALRGLQKFRAAQVYRWLHQRGATSFDEMTDLSKDLRVALKESFEIRNTEIAIRRVSKIDGTKKYLFRLNDGEMIESVLMKYKHGYSICISTQVGCKMGCTFCATGKSGFSRDLLPSEMISEIQTAQKDIGERISNVVLMGMGEPLDNAEQVIRSLEVLTSDWGYGWSPTRITVSTIGVIPAMRELLRRTRVHLAVSLHDPIPAERAAMMPAERRYPIEQVVAELRRHDFAHQRRISFEYIVFRGVNDTPAHVAALTRLLAGLRCRINLIRFHAIPDAPFEGADEPTMVRLRDELSRRGITTTIRASRGEDIQAACGLLSTLRQGNGSPAGRKESPEASGSEPHETSSDARCGTTIAPERTEPDNKKTIP